MGFFKNTGNDIYSNIISAIKTGLQDYSDKPFSAIRNLDMQTADKYIYYSSKSKISGKPVFLVFDTEQIVDRLKMMSAPIGDISRIYIVIGTDKYPGYTASRLAHITVMYDNHPYSSISRFHIDLNIWDEEKFTEMTSK